MAEPETKKVNQADQFNTLTFCPPIRSNWINFGICSSSIYSFSDLRMAEYPDFTFGYIGSLPTSVPLYAILSDLRIRMAEPETDGEPDRSVQYVDFLLDYNLIF